VTDARVCDSVEVNEMAKADSRRGLWAIPAASVLIFGSFMLMQASPQPSPHSEASFASFVTSPGAEVASALLILGLICLLLGLIALQSALMGTPAVRWAVVGLVLAVLALCLLIGLQTILAIALPTLGDYYLSGHLEVGASFEALSGGGNRIGMAFIVGLISLLASAVCFGVAVWRSSKFSKWLGLVLAVGLVLANTFGPLVIIGSLALAISGYLMTGGFRVGGPARAWDPIDRRIERLPQRWLLASGIAGPALFLTVMTVAGAIRPGYDPISQYGSSLGIGPNAWLQNANFVLFGLLMIAFAAGVRLRLRNQAAGEAGPGLLAVSGFGLILAGVFNSGLLNAPSAAAGSTPTTLTWWLHDVGGAAALIGIFTTCFVFARRFVIERGWGSYAIGSIVTGIVGIAGYFEEGDPNIIAAHAIGLEQRIDVVIGMSWLVLVSIYLLRHRSLVSNGSGENASIPANDSVMAQV
jgi:hypothetical membrane protein